MTGKQGPKTKSGKAKSAKNSTVHGLRSENLATPQQQENYDEFLKELITFYKPVGPLEKLQLERIAVCRAKLKALYDIERYKYESLCAKYDADLTTQINLYSYLTPLTRGMLRELITYKRLLLPNGLHVDLLTSIVHEIDSFVGDITSDDDLRQCLPILSSYVDQIDSNAKELHRKLIAVGEQLQRVIDRGESYHEFGELIYKVLVKSSQKKEKKLTPEEIAHAKAIDDYVEKAQARMRAEYGIKVKEQVVEFPSASKIEDSLSVYKTIMDAHHDAHIFKDEILQNINLGKKALSLPIEEADLLMRYQTSWERRLSTLIGEFLQLQRMRLADEATKVMLKKSSRE